MFGSVPYALEQPPRGAQPSWPWAQQIRNRVVFPNHVAGGRLNTLINESNSLPYTFIDTIQDSLLVDSVNNQIILPAWNGFFATSAMKRRMLVFRNQQKVVVDDQASAYRIGNFVASATKMASNPGLQLLSAPSGKYHLLPIDSCIPDPTQPFYLPLFGSGVMTGSTIQLPVGTQFPNWIPLYDPKRMTDQTLLFVNGYHLSGSRDFFWSSNFSIQVNNLYGGLTASVINCVEIYFLAPRLSGRLRQASMVLNGIPEELIPDVPENTRFLGVAG